MQKNLFQEMNKIYHYKNQDMRLIFIPRPAPTGARNRGSTAGLVSSLGRIQGDWVPLKV